MPPAERVLVHGITGSIGSAAVQLLAHLGDRVTAVCASEHDELVRGLGADLVIHRFAEEIASFPERYDVVLDAVGKSTFGHSRRILLPGGRYVSTDLGLGWQNLPLSGLTRPRPGRLSGGRHVVEEIGGLLVTGAFIPLLSRRYGLDASVEAYRYAEAGEKMGNVVIHLEHGAVNIACWVHRRRLHGLWRGAGGGHARVEGDHSLEGPRTPSHTPKPVAARCTASARRDTMPVHLDTAEAEWSSDSLWAFTNAACASIRGQLSRVNTGPIGVVFP